MSEVSSPRPEFNRSLAELGICLRQETPGERRAACPQCARSKVRKADTALAVKIEPEGSATWCCHRCGWKGALAPPGEPVRRRWQPSRHQHRPAPDRPPAGSGGPAARLPEPNDRKLKLAQDLWRQTEDIWPGLKLPWRYLREVRGIRRWNHDRLRWHSCCPWTDDATGRLLHVGCLIAPVNAAVGGLVVGVWRIRPALMGKVERKGLGPTKGNCSRLFPATGPVLAITEGVEDALAYRELSGIPSWAALSAGNMTELILPPRFREVHVIADADEGGLLKAREAVLRFRREGRGASLILPTEGKDANDVLRRRAVGW
jgi:putative DNA primase/helicase